MISLNSFINERTKKMLCTIPDRIQSEATGTACSCPTPSKPWMDFTWWKACASQRTIHYNQFSTTSKIINTVRKQKTKKLSETMKGTQVTMCHGTPNIRWDGHLVILSAYLKVSHQLTWHGLITCASLESHLNSEGLSLLIRKVGWKHKAKVSAERAPAEGFTAISLPRPPAWAPPWAPGLWVGSASWPRPTPGTNQASVSCSILPSCCWDAFEGVFSKSQRAREKNVLEKLVE